MEPNKLHWADRFTAGLCGQLGGYSDIIEWAAEKWLVDEWKYYTPEEAVYWELDSWDNEYYFTQGAHK